MAETMAHGYSSESIQRELSNEYQHDRVWMVFKIICILVVWPKVALALEGLTQTYGNLWDGMFTLYRQCEDLAETAVFYF